MKAQRDPAYQAVIMTEAFGVERAYKLARELAQKATGQKVHYWYDVLKKIDYTPPPPERTPAEAQFDRMCEWMREQGIEFTPNKWLSTVTVHGNQPKFR